MPHRKAEYDDVCGHEVTIQQVNEGGSPSAWIDGYAAYIFTAMENCSETGVDRLVNERLESGEEWEAIEAILSWMVTNDKYFCDKCDSFYDAENVISTGFAGHKCGACANDDATCDDGGNHDWKCTNPRQRHNARVATKYSCQKCDATKRSTPTG